MNGSATADGLGAVLVDASAWLALFLYPAGLMAGRLPLATERRARDLFTLGGVVFLAHVALAFVVHYHLSHSVALQETARQTEESTGIASGFGLYLNYLFALLWWGEIVWWRAGPSSYRSRSSAVTVAIHGFFLFMILNGAVVFVAGPRRLLGVGILVLCALALASGRKPRR